MIKTKELLLEDLTLNNQVITNGGSESMNPPEWMMYKIGQHRFWFKHAGDGLKIDPKLPGENHLN